MTVSVSDRVSNYTGNGVTTDFAVGFQFFEIAVYADNVLVDETEYTIDQDEPGVDGTVQFLTAPPAGTAIKILGNTTVSQETDYVENDGFPADTHERALDRLTMALLDFKRDLGQVDTTNFIESPDRLVKINDDGEFEAYEPGEAGYVWVDEDGVASVTTPAEDTPVTLASVTQAVKALTYRIGDAVVSFAPSPAPGRVRLTQTTQTLNKSTWPELSNWLANLSSPYPWGSTSTTFNLPPAAGYFLRFAATDGTIDPDGPRLAGSTQDEALKAHGHSGETDNDGSHSHDFTYGTTNAGSGGGGTFVVANGDISTSGKANTVAVQAEGVHSHTFETDETGGTETRPKNVAMHLDIIASSSASMAALGSYGFAYTFDTSSTASAGLSAGEVRVNNATLSSVTELYVHATDAWSVNLSSVLATIEEDQLLRLTAVGAQNNALVVRVTAAPVIAASIATIAVAVVSSNGSFDDGVPVALEFMGGRNGVDGVTVPNITGLPLLNRSLMNSTAVGIVNQGGVDYKYYIQNLTFDFTDPEYGGVGDGVTNNDAAWTAIAAAVTAAGGGVIRFPRGNFKFNSTASFATTVPVAVIGDAPQVTKLTFSGAANNGLTFDNATNSTLSQAIYVSSISLIAAAGAQFGLRILGAGTPASTDKRCQYIFLEDLRVNGFATDGVRLSKCTNFIVDTIFSSNNVNGFVANSCGDGRIDRLKTGSNTGTGLIVDGQSVGSAWNEGVYCHGCVLNGDAAGVTFARGFYFGLYNSQVGSTANGAVNIDDVDDCWIVANEISNALGNADGITMNNAPERAFIIANFINGCKNYGIVARGSNHVISTNILHGNSATTGRDIQLVDTTNSAITSNVCASTPSANHSIEESGTSDYNTYTANVLHKSDGLGGAGGITLAGSNSKRCANRGVGFAVPDDYQPLDSDLTAIAALSTTSYGRGLLTLANQAALIAEVSSAYQPLDSDLTAIAALSTTSYGRGLLTLANQAALIAEVSSAYQPLDSDLTSIAALSTTSYGRSLLTLANQAALIAEVSSAYQPLDSDLTAIAALTTTSFGRSLLTLADASALRTTAGLAYASQSEAETGTSNAVAMTPQSVTQAIVANAFDFKNLVGRNGGMEVWQRGTSIAVPASTTAYTVDGFYLTTGANQASVVSRQTGLTNGSSYAAKVLRNNGQTGTGTMRFAIPLDTDELMAMRGKALVLSFSAKAGANFSPTSGTLTYNLYCGTGAVSKRNGSAYTSESNPITGSVNLTTTTSRTISSISSAVSTSITQAELQFSWTPTGTAGADDSFHIDDIQINVVPAGVSAVTPTFERLSYLETLRLCQRHLWVYGEAAAPVNSPICMGQATTTTLGLFIATYPQRLRSTTPTLIYSAQTDFYCINATNTGSQGSTAVATSTISQDAVEVSVTVAAALFTAGNASFIRVLNAGGYIGASAEI